MIIAQILSPVHSLGPGERICLWTQGCRKHCSNCISPELQPFTGNEVSEEALSRVILYTAQKGSCTGLTISGGDPFEQSDSLLGLLRLLREGFEDILVYTGYTLEEIYEGCAGNAGKECLTYIDVLIDGRYIDELNTSDCVLRGSSNQKIHFLNKRIEERYSDYLKSGRVLENFVHEGISIITGIINREEEL